MAVRNEETGQFTSDEETSVQEPAGGSGKPASDFDRAALESKVKDRLASVFSDGDASSADETDETSAGENEEVQETSDDQEDNTEQEAASDSEDAEQDDEEEAGAAATPPAKPGSNAPTLPAAYRRSLKAYGWEDAEIDGNFKALGSAFLKTAAAIHANRNAELSTWAAQGRAAREQQPTEGDDETQPTPAAKPAKSKKAALKPLDVAKLKEHYGDSGVEAELIDTLAGQINPVIEQINEILPRIEKSQQTSQQAELETLGRRVEEFFAGEELKPYTELYGNGKDEFTDGQLKARNKVLEFADALVMGARMQRRNLSLGEALTLAHDSVSSGFKVKAATTGLKKSMKQRQKGITLKPGNKAGKVSGGDGKVTSRSDLEKKVKAGLAKAFG